MRAEEPPEGQALGIPKALLQEPVPTQKASLTPQTLELPSGRLKMHIPRQLAAAGALRTQITGLLGATTVAPEPRTGCLVLIVPLVLPIGRAGQVSCRTWHESPQWKTTVPGPESSLIPELTLNLHHKQGPQGPLELSSSPLHQPVAPPVTHLLIKLPQGSHSPAPQASANVVTSDIAWSASLPKVTDLG